MLAIAGQIEHHGFASGGLGMGGTNRQQNAGAQSKQTTLKHSSVLLAASLFEAGTAECQSGLESLIRAHDPVLMPESGIAT